MTIPKYQKNLSAQSPILLNAVYKRPKVEKMLAILEDAGALDGTGQVAVDVGCSGGFFAQALAPYFKVTIGIDIDQKALTLACQTSCASNVTYVLGDSLQLPLPDASVDLVICNHVYEHVPSAAQLFVEIERVLKPGALCYLGAASRLTVIEPHYHLPFLSWLPKTLAHLYMRATGKGQYYYEKLATYTGIKRLISRFQVTDYTLRVVADPDRFKARDLIPRGGWIGRIPLLVWRLVYPMLPSYIFILKKGNYR